ncbi:MAG: hypothetical protein ACPGN3_11770 [Opitutales bacterium]
MRLRKRTRQLLLFTALVLVLGAVVTIDMIRNMKPNPEDTVERLPKIPVIQEEIDWKDPVIDTPEPEEILATFKEDFEPLRIRKTETKVAPQPEAAEPEPVELPPEASIVFDERPVVPKEESAVDILELPFGTMIYARLITPIYSHSASGQRVTLELTRSLVIDARSILIHKTRLSGKVTGLNNGHVEFERQWQITDGFQKGKVLEVQLQQADYDPHTARYGPLDGANGIRMADESKDIEIEPTKAEQLFLDIVKPAISRSLSPDDLYLPDLSGLGGDPFGGSPGMPPDPPGFFVPSGALVYLVAE